MKSTILRICVLGIGLLHSQSLEAQNFTSEKCPSLSPEDACALLTNEKQKIIDENQTPWTPLIPMPHRAHCSPRNVSVSKPITEGNVCLYQIEINEISLKEPIKLTR